MENVSGITGAGPIWREFMQTALLGRPALDFAEPPGLTRVQVCALSGLLPNPDSPCPHARAEVFIEGTQPTELDSFYRRVRIDTATGQLANANAPADRIVEQTRLVLPSEALEWARDNGIETANEQISNLLSPTSGLQPPTPDLQITHPDQGTVYQISPVTPRETQRIAVAAQAGNNAQFDSVMLLVDGQSIATFSAPPYRALWTLDPGAHTFSARGVDRNGREVTSSLVRVTVLP
jgi:hypothetical protein